MSNPYVKLNSPPKNPEEEDKRDTQPLDLGTILSSLECPVCLDIFQIPIYMCNTGHNICGRCSENMQDKICPQCRNKIGNTRNFSLEQIIQKCGAKCKNAEKGCTFYGTKNAVEDHLVNCSFGKYSCPLKEVYNRCAWQGKYEEMVSHFKNIHPTKVIIHSGSVGGFLDYDIDKEYENGCPKEKMAYWAVQKLDNSPKIPNFTYKVSLHSPNKYVSMLFECTPVTQSFQEVFKSGNCIIIPLAVIKNFLNEKKRFYFKIHLTPSVTVRR